jgi:hypothetical protein
MAYRKQIVCDSCGHAEAHDPEKANVPQGWVRLLQANVNLTAELERHWCHNCYIEAGKALRTHNH